MARVNGEGGGDRGRAVILDDDASGWEKE